MQITIDNNLVYPDGKRGRTYLQYPTDHLDVPTSTEAIALELNYSGSISGIPGIRLIEEREDGEIMQEFCLAPDIFWALIEYMRTIKDPE